MVLNGMKILKNKFIIKECGRIHKKKDMELKNIIKIILYIKDIFQMEEKMKLDTINGMIILIIWENGQEGL